MKPLTRLCSEERLLRARRGQLSSCEWHDLADHLAACADCRMDWRLVRDFDQSAAVRQGDEKLLASAMKVALATPKQRLRRLSRFAVAAAVLLTAGASASGAMLWHLHSAAPTVEPAPGKSGDGRPGAARSVVHAVVPPNDRETAQEPETAAPELPPTPPARALPRRARAARALASLQPSPSEVPDAGLAPLAARETAYGLLGQAMAERQEGSPAPRISLRTRREGKMVRIEIAPDELPRALTPEMAQKFVEIFKALGFSFVALDLEGYRTGSLNTHLVDIKK